MKTTLLFVLILLGKTLCGQNQTTEWFKNLKPTGVELNKAVRQAWVFSLDTLAVREAYMNNPDQLRIRIPLPDGSYKSLNFLSHEIHAKDFDVLDAEGKSVLNAMAIPRHFKGKATGDGKEMAALTLFSSGHLILVYSSEKGNLNITQLPEKQGNRDEYISFYDHQMKRKNPFQCHSEHIENETRENRQPPGTGTQSDTTCRVAEIYWECDHDMFQKGGNSIQGALNQFEAMFNGTAILFEGENVNIGVKTVKVWNTPDPYSYSSSFAALEGFRDAGNEANWPGQLAHLLSTRPAGLGGVAYLDALCTNLRYGFSNIDFFFNELPAYSWTISTIAHELGHNFASPHTHNCFWELSPGVFGQIDSCWNAEGNCQNALRGRVGTVMSYCHLTGSVNLSLGFGPLPGNRIREAYADMPCVPGTITIPNFLPTNSGPFCVGDSLKLSVTEVPGAVFRWIGPGNFTSSEREPILVNAPASAEGKYNVSVKIAACESRMKRTEVVLNCMPIQNLPASVCAGGNLTILFRSTGIFGSGNRFIAQLSNSSGSFLNPFLLDTLESSQPGLLSGKIPTGLSLGNGYRVRVISTDPPYIGKPFSKGLQINPMGAAPQPLNGERCGPGIVRISASGGTNLIWFPDLNEPLPSGTGRIFTTPPLNQTRSFFVQSGGTTKAKAGLTAPVVQAPTTSETDGIRFTSHSTFRLDSVTLVHETMVAGGSLCQLLLKKDGAIWYSKNVNSSGSRIKIPLYWRVDPGTGYELLCQNILVPMVRIAAPGTAFPASLSNLLTLEGSTSGNPDYPYLFQWVISRYSGCPSARREVLAVVRPGQAPETPLLEQVGDSMVCFNAGSQFEWMINGQIQGGWVHPKIRGLQNSSYQVRYKTDSCWSDWSAPETMVVTSNRTLDFAIKPGIYPNPSRHMVQWEGPDVPTRITLLETTGKEIWTKTLSGTQTLDPGPLPPGLYFIRWSTPSENGTQSLIRE